MSTVCNIRCIFHLNYNCLCKRFHVIWIIVLYFTQIGINYSEAAKYNQDDYLNRLGKFDITIPSRVTREGDHVSYSLHPGHTVRRRSTDFLYPSEDDIIHYKVQVENQDLLLKLKPNYKLTSPSFVIERKKNSFKNVTDSSFKHLDDSYSNCHFHGEVVNQTESRVAVGVCNGLHGFLHTSDVQYFIEPLQRDPISPEGHHRHVVYRRSALPIHLDLVMASHIYKRSTTEDDSCGVKDTSKAVSQRERWEQHHRERRKTTHRKKRSVSTERYVETLVVVDPKMVEYHASEHLETYVLTIMNMVATMFHDATVGNSINIVLVRILIMEEADEDLEITHHADNTLKSFCKFQKRVNFKDDDHPNHHDVAILLTRHNICSRVNEPCSTLGLAQVAGMCQPHRSCNINEDTGLALAYTVTHELGHNFGMHHDGYNNGCEDPPGKQLYIMSPSLVADSLRKSWSNCSKAAITKFIDRDWGYCLDDEPAQHLYDFPVLPPGTMYDADHQCRLQYGTDDTEICTDKEDVCSNLWCRINNRCSTHLEAAAEGTICGTNKWCYEGKCVKIGDRPESINGEWGQWSAWTECTRTCGAGVSHSQRHCDNPQPSHGGKYCLGERKRYRICNTEDCPENSPSFNQVQCEEFNYVPYKNGLYEWEHVPTTESPCQLHCKPQNQFFSVLLKDIVTDGTPCTAGTRNMCISGRCRHIGCDYVIDSKAIEDRCGICHGDGSTCTTIKSQYNETQGLGYVQAAVIPIGARNIRVEEVAAANNFLALQNDKGEYFLNGHWFIQWTGDYKIAGTTVHYEREGNIESVTAQGPLKEPLHVMLLLQSENPGVTFEYTVPKENISEARVPEFKWSYLPWTHCTSSCGGGTQRSEVACTEIEAGIVEDKYCSEIPKPDDKQKVCNEHLCPARWWHGPWQHCSVTCGDNGVHQRTVICVRSLGPDEQIALDDEACSDQEKPKEVEPCHKKEPCAGTSPWIVGDWSSCNENPCGLKYRSVSCEDPIIGCHQNEIPVSEMLCSNITCGQWVTEDWVECTRSCGHGIQYRKVVCEGGIQCDPHKEPASERNCNLKPCPIHSPSSEPSKEPDSQTALPSATDSITESTIATEPSDISSQTTSFDLNTQQNLPESSTTPVASDEKTSSERNDGKFDVTDSGKDTEHENKESFTVADSEPKDKITDENEEQEIEQLYPVEGGVNDLYPEDTNLKPTTSDEIELTSMKNINPEMQKENSDTESNIHIDSENENVSDNLHDVENQPVPHKHRHHHGEYLGVIEETGVNERNLKGNDNVVIKSRVDGGETEAESTELESEKTDISIEKSNNMSSLSNYGLDNSSQTDQGRSPKTTITVSQTHFITTSATKTILSGMESGEENGQSGVDKSSVDPLTKSVNLPTLPDLKALPKLNEMPPLPDMDSLPPLPSKNLPPLPDISNLPPLPDKDIPNLPDIDKLPLLPDKDSHLSHLSEIDDLPPIQDKDLPPLPDKSELSPLPDENVPPLFSPDEIPPAQNTHKEPSGFDMDNLPPLKGLPPLPNPEDLPALPDKDLPPLPDKDKLAPLPDLGDLPPLPDLPHLPDIERLSPLPISESEKIRPDSEETSADVFILSSNIGTNKENISEPNMKLSNNNDSGVISSEGVASILNKSALSSDVLNRLYKDDSKEENYTWRASDWSECSSFCGGGVRTRSVVCIDIETDDHTDEINCDINFKPNPTLECNTQTCLNWVVSEWDRCSAPCGDSVQKRIVYCPKELACDPKSRPVDTQECDVPKCVKWVSGQWSRCTKTCGGGEQYRLIQCVNTETQQFAMGCDIADKPVEKQNCSMEDCPEQKAAALTVGCEHNEMSSVVCRALMRMQQCSNRFVAVKCCKTCGSKHNKNRPKESSLR